MLHCSPEELVMWMQQSTAYREFMITAVAGVRQECLRKCQRVILWSCQLCVYFPHFKKKIQKVTQTQHRKGIL